MREDGRNAAVGSDVETGMDKRFGRWRGEQVKRGTM
jgi:hypothetical protein